MEVEMEKITTTPKRDIELKPIDYETTVRNS